MADNFNPCIPSNSLPYQYPNVGGEDNGASIQPVIPTVMSQPSSSDLPCCYIEASVPVVTIVYKKHIIPIAQCSCTRPSSRSIQQQPPVPSNIVIPDERFPWIRPSAVMTIQQQPPLPSNPGIPDETFPWMQTSGLVSIQQPEPESFCSRSGPTQSLQGTNITYSMPPIQDISQQDMTGMFSVPMVSKPVKSELNVNPIEQSLVSDTEQSFLFSVPVVSQSATSQQNVSPLWGILPVSQGATIPPNADGLLGISKISKTGRKPRKMSSRVSTPFLRIQPKVRCPTPVDEGHPFSAPNPFITFDKEQENETVKKGVKKDNNSHSQDI